MVVCTLQQILEQRGLSQRALAKRSGLHRDTIARLCRDEWLMIDRGTLNMLCGALRVRPARLFRWEDEDL